MSARPRPRERLLDAADELLFTGGIAATPVDAVLARAGVAPATLYAHFRNKEGLVVSALRRRLERWDRQWQEAVDAETDDHRRLLAVFDALQRFRLAPAAARWCAFLGTAAERPHPDGDLARTLADDTRLFRDRLTALAVPVAHDGAEALAEQLLLVVTGVLAMMLRGDADAAIERGRATAEVLVRAARPAEPS
ncbi:TetR/AcrR family transcriptional regulator [Umezawaea beigongshangensis]|uniref:TetR/AcrR family transcriptional regulator n=1 Tax=Umezawaea beigongshangensis TaxID=2780383 RepID=UPI0018F1B2C8|nr:TetR/AcrR family transcriptional regulator [Umezawaea beigongshangensis]